MSKLLKRVLSSLCSLVSTGVLSNAGSSAKRVKLQDAKTEIKKIGKSEGSGGKKKVNSTGKGGSLDEFLGSELERNKSEGDKKFQVGGETVFFRGALSRSRKEALRARGALSILKDDRIRDIVRNLDSDKLREMSKNNKLASDVLYGVFGTLNVVPFIPAILDGIRALKMNMIFEQVLYDCNKLSEEDKNVVSRIGLDKEEFYFNGLVGALAAIVESIIGRAYVDAHYSDPSGPQVKLGRKDWDKFKGELSKSNDLIEKVVKPFEEWRELWISLGGSNSGAFGDIFVKKLGVLALLLTVSAPLAGVANNLSQRFQGRSNELGVLADKIDSLNKKSIGKAHKSLKPYRGI